MTFLERHILANVRRLQPCQMDEICAETGIFRRLGVDLSIDDIRHALHVLQLRRLLVDVTPTAHTPLWRATIVGDAILDATPATDPTPDPAA